MSLCHCFRTRSFSPGFRRVCGTGHWQVTVHPVSQVPGSVLVLPFLRFRLLLRPGGDPHRALQETDSPAPWHWGLDSHQHRLCHGYWPGTKRAASLHPLLPAILGVPRPGLWWGQWPSTLLVPAVPHQWNFRRGGRLCSRKRSAGRPGRRKCYRSPDQASQGLLTGGQAYGCIDWDMRSSEAPPATAQSWHWLCGFRLVRQLQSEDPQQAGATLPVHFHQRRRVSWRPVKQGRRVSCPQHSLSVIFFFLGLEATAFYMDQARCVCFVAPQWSWGFQCMTQWTVCPNKSRPCVAGLLF